jgi:hypothetical protein
MNVSAAFRLGIGAKYYSNTGVRNGACFLLEKAIGRNILNLAYRHHVHELLVKNVIKDTMKPYQKL